MEPNFYGIQMVLEVVLLIIIFILIVWIYFFGGRGLQFHRLSKENEELQTEIEGLKMANKALRSTYAVTRKETSTSINSVLTMAENLERVKGALLGSKSIRKDLKEEFGKELGPDLVKSIQDLDSRINSSQKKRLAHGILVGELGSKILRGLDGGKSIEEISAELGIPLQSGRRKVRVLQTLGYLDGRLNLTEEGRAIQVKD